MPALERLYWFTIEFGLIASHGGPQIYGAGLLSSFGEMPHALSDEVERTPFSIKEVITTPYSYSEMQPKLFVIRSFDALVAETKRWLKNSVYRPG